QQGRGVIEGHDKGLPQRGGNSRQTDGVEIVRGDDLGSIEAEARHHVTHVGQERVRRDHAGNTEPWRTDAALVPAVIAEVFSVLNVGSLRSRQSLSRSPEQAALTLGPDAVKLAGCNLQARDQPRPNQGRLKRGLGKAPVSGLLGSQNEILVGAADETDTRLAHIAERAQEAEGLKAIQRNGAWMSRIARDPFPRLHSRREGLGTVQDGGKIGEIRPGFDLGQPKASGTSVLSPREEQYHLFLNVG